MSLGVILDLNVTVLCKRGPGRVHWKFLYLFIDYQRFSVFTSDMKAFIINIPIIPFGY